VLARVSQSCTSALAVVTFSSTSVPAPFTGVKRPGEQRSMNGSLRPASSAAMPRAATVPQVRPSVEKPVAMKQPVWSRPM
jgi:hypothetical protein